MTVKFNNLFLPDLNPTLTICGSIDIYENAWKNSKDIIPLLEQQCANTDSGVYWDRAGTIGQGAYQNARTNKMLSVSYMAEIADNRVCQEIHNTYYTMLLSAGINYAKRYAIDEGLWHEPYSILKYSSGEEYKAHYDGGTGVGRAISAICYFNDDYEGGEIEFVNFDVKIKPKAGMLILFPSNYTYRHIAHPIISGTKYAIVTWIRDRQV